MAEVIKEPGIRIPGDVLTGIFYKLPHKSLARFKSVEKEWNSLISNYEFVNAYRTRKLERGHHHQLVFAKYYTARQIYLYTAEFKDDQELLGLELAPLKIPHQLLNNDNIQVRVPPEFLGSFNGLLGMLVVLRNGNTDFVLWNPLTSKYVTCSFHQRRSTVFDKGDDDDYSKYKIICESLRGLCYDYSSHAYVAVVVNNHRIFKQTGRVVETEIYIANFKTGEFTTLPSSALGLGEYASSQLNGGVGTVVCGVPHWVKVTYSESRNIIYFDLEDKCFKHMEGPSAELEEDSYRRGSLVVGLGSLDGGRQLSVVLQETFDGEEQLSFEVWVMKEYGDLESWSKLFVIRDCGILTQLIRSINVLGFMENGEWLISVNDTKVYAYDPKKVGLRFIQMEEYRGWFFSSIVANEPSFISDPTSTQ